MKFTILQSKLKEGLNMVEKIVGKNLTLPALNNVLISIEKNFLSLTTTDLELGIKWRSLVKTEKEGKIAIPARILSSFINYFPDKPVIFETKEKSLIVECENYHTQIKYFESDDFPIIPQIERNELIILNNSSFCKSLALVSDIPQPSPARAEISGVYLSFQSNLLKIAATDSFRLGEKKLYLEKPVQKNYAFILPQKTAREIIGIMGDKKGELNLFISQNQVMFEFSMEEVDYPQIQVFSRLIEGEYPNYEEVVPKDYQMKAVLLKNEFLNQIKAASVFSGKTNEVKFLISPKKQRIEILSQDAEYGQYRSFLPAEIDGKKEEKEMAIAFNHKFLIDGISNIESSEVTFEFNGEEKAGVLKPVGDQNYLYVAMPIKAT